MFSVDKEIEGKRVSGGLGRGAVDHAHHIEGPADGGQGALDIVFVDLTDAADAEGLGDRQLAGVDDVAAAAQVVVEADEIEVRIGRRVKGDDDRRLELVGQQERRGERLGDLGQSGIVVTGCGTG